MINLGAKNGPVGRIGLRLIMHRFENLFLFLYLYFIQLPKGMLETQTVKSQFEFYQE